MVRSLNGSQGVKFGIAKFGALFGTADGRQLQSMSERFRWPLPLGSWSTRVRIFEVLGLWHGQSGRMGGC